MRTVAQDGTVELIVQFTDGNGDPVAPDGDVIVSLFEPDFPPFDPDVTDGDAIVLDAIVAPVSGTTGLYSYTYTLAPDSSVGVWYDRWEAEIDGVPIEMIFDFTVTEKTSIVSAGLAENMIVTVTLDSSIANEDGVTLGTNQEVMFSTTLNPMYASSDLLSLEIGSFIPGIPEFTLDLAIHWASVQADAHTFKRRAQIHPVTNAPVYSNGARNQDYFDVMRTQYVLCRAGHMMINNVLSNAVKSKTLADLSVSYDTGRLTSKLADLEKCISETRRILNSNGTLSEGASLPATSTVKGAKDIDRPPFGREWASVSGVRSGANSRSLSISGRRVRRHWSDRTQWDKE